MSEPQAHEVACSYPYLTRLTLRDYSEVLQSDIDEVLAGWRGRGVGSQISRSTATAFWISWAPDPSLLVGSHTLPKEYIQTSRGQYKKLACEFKNYPKVNVKLSPSAIAVVSKKSHVMPSLKSSFAQSVLYSSNHVIKRTVFFQAALEHLLSAAIFQTHRSRYFQGRLCCCFAHLMTLFQFTGCEESADSP